MQRIISKANRSYHETKSQLLRIKKKRKKKMDESVLRILRTEESQSEGFEQFDKAENCI